MTFLSDKPSLCGFLKLAKIYCENDSIIISANKFQIDILIGKNEEQALVEAFASVLGKLTKIKFEESIDNSNDNVQISMIDEL